MDSENEQGRDFGKAMLAFRCVFRDNLQPIDIFEDAVLQAVRKSLQPPARMKNAMRAKRFRLPTPYVFILWMRAVYWENGCIDMQMTYWGTAISYNYGLRSSEYTRDDKNKGEHAIRAGDVFFIHINVGN